MDHKIGLVGFKQLHQQAWILDPADHLGKGGLVAQLGVAGLFQGGFVIIGHGVQPDHGKALFQQAQRRVIADKPGGSGDQNGLHTAPLMAEKSAPVFLRSTWLSIPAGRQMRCTMQTYNSDYGKYRPTPNAHSLTLSQILARLSTVPDNEGWPKPCLLAIRRNKHRPHFRI